MIDGQRRAHRPAGIAGSGLNPDSPESAVAQNFSVGDAVQRDAAGQAEVFERRSRRRSERVMRSTISSSTV